MRWQQLGVVCLTLSLRAECLAGEALTLRFYNYVSAPENMLKAAQRQTDTLFRAVGIDLTWVECPRSQADAERGLTCPWAHDSASLVLQLIPFAMAAEYARPAGELGLATYPDAYIFFDRLQEYCKNRSLEEAKVLGAIMAHETGHLLLGPKSHSSTGIMQAILGPVDLTAYGRCPFTRSQGKRMRGWIRERTSRDSANRAVPGPARAGE